MRTTTASRRNNRAAGFSLIELMVSVAIVGILASVATPMLVKYIKKAKTTEAREMLQKISAGARVYYLESHSLPGSITPLPSQFPNPEPLTPVLSCCASGGTLCQPSQALWTTPSWVGLMFSMDDPHYYQYEFRSAGVSNTSTYSAIAIGDLDCDTRMSTFMMVGAIAPSGEVTKGANIARIDELE